jgi:hypothetical protein
MLGSKSLAIARRSELCNAIEVVPRPDMVQPAVADHTTVVDGAVGQIMERDAAHNRAVGSFRSVQQRTGATACGVPRRNAVLSPLFQG